MRDETCYCTGKFNVAFSLCGVLGVALYFSKSFSEAAARRSAVVEIPQLLGVIIVYFLEQESSLQSSIPQQKHRLFSKCFLHLSLVNLPLLASLEERFIHRVLGCFLGVEDGDDLEEGFLADKATGDDFSYSGRPWQDRRWKLFLTSKSETQRPLSLPVLHSGICSHVPSSSN